MTVITYPSQAVGHSKKYELSKTFFRKWTSFKKVEKEKKDKVNGLEN